MNTRKIQKLKWGKKESLTFKKDVIFTWKRLVKLNDRYSLQGKRDVFVQRFGTDIEIISWWMNVISDPFFLETMPLSRNLHCLHVINQKIEQTLNDLS